MKQLLFVLAIIFLTIGCKGPLSAPVKADSKQGEHNVVVDEVLQVVGYTYLNVTEDKRKTWLAIPTIKAAQGDRFYYNGGLEMTDFFSKELNRTFKNVIFLESISKEPTAIINEGMLNSKHVAEVKTEKINISIDPCKGCLTVGKLLETRTDYSGRNIKIKGRVTKFNPAIMGKNWIHIQDGTEFNGGFDLTITTDSQLAIGDTATFEGKITLKKDFGYGYFYEVIMEDGKLVR